MKDAPTTDRATVYTSQDERDKAMEARYSYDREGTTSTLMYVSQNQHELALEYLDSWRPYHANNESVRTALPRFESWRFGAMPEESAHQTLLFAVLWRAYPKDFVRLGPPPPIIGSRPAGDVARLEAAVGDLAREQAMPEPSHMSNYAKNERERELREQADELREPGEDG